ncbi:uncharacterized protein [Montipora foliosa]|uniref:uncharacterized protein n=1 Tax=Montipora foliosa TaxID=591990 RepID=UPI0035F1149A
MLAVNCCYFADMDFLLRCYIVYPLLYFGASYASYEEEALALKEVSGGTRISGVRYANFIQDKFAYLNITPVRKRLVERSIQCALSCLDTLPCFSFNLAALQDNNDKLLCEHLPSDKYNNSDQFVASKVFHHFSILSPCSSWPCNGNGKCVALYAENSYLCICKTGFIGQNCENDIDECSAGNNCDLNAVCANTEGSYHCSCNKGYTGDGRHCTAMMNSVILSSDGFYLRHLAKFLSPVIGDDSRWELCYRSSAHGTYDRTFHNKCDGKNNTVTIVKTNDFVFGGFTDIPWESPQNGSQFGATEKAFIFSLRNAEGLPPFKSNVKDSSKAIRYSKILGPTFGYEDILIDRRLTHWAGSSTNFGDNYIVPTGVQNKSTLLAGASTFGVDEVEVFFLL